MGGTNKRKQAISSNVGVGFIPILLGLKGNFFFHL